MNNIIIIIIIISLHTDVPCLPRRMPRQVASVRVPARTDAANHPPVVTNDLNYESRDGGNIAWPGEEERKAVVRE